MHNLRAVLAGRISPDGNEVCTHVGSHSMLPLNTRQVNVECRFTVSVYEFSIKRKKNVPNLASMSRWKVEQKVNYTCRSLMKGKWLGEIYLWSIFTTKSTLNRCTLAWLSSRLTRDENREIFHQSDKNTLYSQMACRNPDHSPSSMDKRPCGKHDFRSSNLHLMQGCKGRVSTHTWAS